MHKIIKRLILFAFLMIVSAVVTLTLLGVFYGKDAQRIISEKINTEINADLAIESAGFSMLKHFPKAGIILKNVSIIDQTGNWKNDTVLFAASVSLMFPYSSLWSNEYRIEKLLIEDATVNYLKNQSGLNNFIRFNNSGSGNASAFDLKNVKLSHVSIHYNDIPNEQDYSFTIQSANCNGKWNSNAFKLETEGIIFTESLNVKGIDYLHKKNSHLKASLYIDNINNDYSIDNAELTIENVDFNVSGGWQNIEKSDNINLAFEIEASKAKFEDLKKLLPDRFLVYLADYKFDGTLAVSSTINGSSDNPVFAISASAKNAGLGLIKNNEKLNKLNFQSHYTNNSGKGVSKLEIKQFTAVLGTEQLRGTMAIDDLSNPRLDLYADGSIRLDLLQKFLQIDTLETMSGLLIIDARITGETAHLKSFRSKGNIEMKEANFKVKGKDLDLSNINGTLTISGNDVTIKNLNGTTGGTDFMLNGRISNMYPYFFEASPKLYVNADLHSQFIDLDELMLKAEEVNKSDTVYRLEFPEGVSLDLSVHVEKLKFRKFNGSNISGSVTLKDRVLTASSLKIDAMKGSVSLSGKIDAAAPDKVIMDYNAQLSDIDINQMFFEMGDFGQDIISSDNLKGTATATIQLESVWTKDLHCDMDKLVVFSSYKIENGELIKFEPIEPLHKYVKGSQLDHIYFEKIENELTIINKKIHFPDFEIKSSALDIIASGTHDFDNNVDYKVQLLLSQLLGSKVKKQNTAFGEIEDDGLGRTKLYLKMKGPLSDPEISIDSEAIQHKIATEIQKEKQNLKNILKEEFGQDKNQKVSAAKQQKQTKQELEIELESEDSN